MRMNKYVYHFVSFQYIYHLIFIFAGAVFKYEGIAVVAS